MIKTTPTLSRYMAKIYLMNTLYLVMALLLVVFLFDTVELIRRASKYSDVPFSLVLQMGILKLPEVGQVMLPFAILFSAMFTFWQLTQRHELIVARSAGFSIWQFLSPFIGVALVIGVLQVAVINPLGAVFVSKFEQMERVHLDHSDSQIALFKEGLWLRQNDEESGGYKIIHASRILQPSWKLSSVTILQFSNDDSFERRLDARQASLEPGRWVLEDVVIHEKSQNQESRPFYAFPTTLTVEEIEDSFASPETMSFWQLPGYIQVLKDTGFDATRLRVHYQSLLAQPLFLAAMVLLAATVSMRPPRFSGAFMLIGLGVFIGFLVFFMSNFLQALGASGQIPVFLAAWAPALICFLLGTTVIMNTEDG